MDIGTQWLKNRAKNKQNKARHKRNIKNKQFYDSKEWLQLRYDVLARYGRECMACGKTKGQMHVDHIVPRSINPSLALRFDNLQVLCRDCNIGKLNRDQTDFRPKVIVPEIMLKKAL